MTWKVNRALVLLLNAVLLYSVEFALLGYSIEGKFSLDCRIVSLQRIGHRVSPPYAFYLE